VSDDETADKPPEDDDARRKFREALERKQHRGGRGSTPSDPGKSMLAHESTKRQRQFRRKSG
jgi:hypothetical protein